MTTTSNYQPGDEVRLKDGLSGVLYARTMHLTAKASQRRRREGWYFLPDGASASGLVVLNQPREISEQDIERKTGNRPGDWPSEPMSDPIMRQRVYVAHMQGSALPGNAVTHEDPECPHL